MSPAGPRDALAAFLLPLEAARLLRRERALWAPALVPLLLSAGTLIAAGFAVVTHARFLYDVAAAWMPSLVAESWLAWLWVGPAWVVLHALALLLFLALAAACLVSAYLLASLLAAPFHEWLSRRVERAVQGAVQEGTGDGGFAGWRDALRSVFEELRRLSFFLAVQAAILAIALTIPGAAVVAAPAMTGVTLLFLPLDYASHVLDRRRVLGFREKRRWVLERIPVMLGYGSSAFLFTLVPGLNLLAMPVLVTGGTLLALRYPPALKEPAPDPAAHAGTTTSP